MEMATKVCKGPCKQRKPLDQFYRHAHTRDGHYNTCKQCDNARRARQKLTNGTTVNPVANRRRVRHYKFTQYNGLTPEAYDAAVVALDKHCQLCQLPAFRLVVDFRDEQVQGLLCYGCSRQVKRASFDPAELLDSTTDPQLSALAHYLLSPPGLPSTASEV